MSVKYISTALATLFCIMSAHAEYSVDLPYQEVKVTNENGKAVFSGAPSYGTPGQPNLPLYVVTFQIPSGTNYDNVKISVVNPVEKTLEGTYYVAPAQPPKESIDTVNNEYPEDVSVYGKNAFFPESWTGKISYSKKREHQFVRVIVNACKYNPVTGKIKMLSGGKLVLTISNQTGSTNYTQSTVRMAAAASAIKPAYVIITTNEIVRASAQLQKFIDQKTSNNYNVVVATENTWGGGKGNIASDRIRNWLKQKYQSNVLNIEYVLLIGNPHPDSGDVPMKLCHPMYDTLHLSQNTATPTDYYYADLSGNWDLNGDGLFGTFQKDFGNGGADQDAEVIVGRIPYYGSSTDLDKILAKSIRYENEVSREWRKRILLPMEPSSASQSGFHLGERVKTDFCDPNQWSYYRLYDEYNGYARQILPEVAVMNPLPERLSCTEKDVLNTWQNDYYGAVLWWTHGSETGAADVFRKNNASYLDDTHPSMTFQVSCYNSHPETSDNLSYSILLNGGITAIGATRISWYSGETYYAKSAYNCGIGYEYMRNLIVNGLPSGDALAEAITSVIPNNGSHWANMIMFTLYGCPDMKLNIPSGVPLPPSSLKATPISNDKINLEWNEPANSNATIYNIELKVNNGKFSRIATVAAGVKNYVISGLSASTKFLFRLRGNNSTTYSTYSNIDSTTTFGNFAKGKYISASSNKNPPRLAVDDNTSTIWTASSSYFPQTLTVDLGGATIITNCEIMFKGSGKIGDCNDYTIRTSLDKITWKSKVNNSINNDISLIQKHTFNDTARYVQIFFVDAPGNDSASIREFRVFGNLCPTAPVWNSIDYSSDNQLTLSWKESAGAKYYTVKRAVTIDGPYIPIGEKITALKYTTLNLLAGSESFFVITASNDYGESMNSIERREVPEYTVPYAPTNLTISTNGNDALSWNDNSRTESGFEIQRALYGQDNWVTMNYTGNNGSFTDTERLPYKAYKYRINAYGVGGFSGNSNTVVSPLYSPQNALAEYYKNSNEIFITWDIMGKNHEKFILERSVGNQNNFQKIADVPPEDPYYQDRNFTTNTTYYYRVCAFNAVGKSQYSPVTYVTTSR